MTFFSRSNLLTILFNYLDHFKSEGFVYVCRLVHWRVIFRNSSFTLVHHLASRYIRYFLQYLNNTIGRSMSLSISDFGSVFLFLATSRLLLRISPFIYKASVPALTLKRSCSRVTKRRFLPCGILEEGKAQPFARVRVCYMSV